jgi:hypothetical protein
MDVKKIVKEKYGDAALKVISGEEALAAAPLPAVRRTT